MFFRSSETSFWFNELSQLFLWLCSKSMNSFAQTGKLGLMFGCSFQACCSIWWVLGSTIIVTKYLPSLLISSFFWKLKGTLFMIVFERCFLAIVNAAGTLVFLALLVISLISLFNFVTPMAICDVVFELLLATVLPSLLFLPRLAFSIPPVVQSRPSVLARTSDTTAPSLLALSPPFLSHPHYWFHFYHQRHLLCQHHHHSF